MQDQLVQVTRPDLSVVTYAYDALGRRIEKNVAGAITRYVYDGEDILFEYDATGAETLIANYAHGPFTDQPLAKTERTGGTRLGDYYYHANHQGSVIRITDAAGLTVNEYQYDAYGNALIAAEAIDNPYRFTGREWDAETGLLYYRARYYDPTTGRFLQQDPIGFAAGDLNLYRYVGSNPVNFNDPNGQAALAVARAGIRHVIVPVSRTAGRACARNAKCAKLVGDAIHEAIAAVIKTRIAVENVIAMAQTDGDDDVGANDDDDEIAGLGHNHPPSECADDDVDGDGEPDGPDDKEKPDLGKKGSGRNPDGTKKNPLDQLEQIEEAKKRNPNAIEFTDKSQQNARHILKPWNYDPNDYN